MAGGRLGSRVMRVGQLTLSLIPSMAAKLRRMVPAGHLAAG